MDLEIQGLQRFGRDVEVDGFFRDSDELDAMTLGGRSGAALSPILGSNSARTFAEKLENFRPDIVHLHNVYPLISPGVIKIARDRGSRVVATIHNFRLRCINGVFFRDGRICTECEHKRVPTPGLVHGCYRDSRIQSAVMATAVSVHRASWRRVDRYIAVSEFIADRLCGWGISKGRISIKPNPVADPGPMAAPGQGFLFAGRLSEEKGLDLLLDSWELSGLDGVTPLLIAGDGPLRREVERRAAAFRSVVLFGAVSASRIAELRRSTAFGVVSSMCFEAHSAVGESFAHGRPVVATHLGALVRTVDETVGWMSPANPNDFAASLRSAYDAPDVAARSRAARERYERTYRSDLVTDQLRGIYEQVLQR